MKKIYLAIPYSGMEESSFNQATEATARIIAANNELNVFSPITHSHLLTKVEGVTVPGNWEFWKKVDYQYIDWADEVWVIIPDEGYDKVNASVGVKAEIAYANQKGMTVIQASMEELLSRARNYNLKKETDE